ncbi:MAG: hypothetical protein WEA29_01195 [Acidimicrobiia bacterium]
MPRRVITTVLAFLVAAGVGMGAALRVRRRVSRRPGTWEPL